MSLDVEYRLAKLYIVEDKEEVIPFLIRVKGASSVKARSAYFVAIDSSLSMDGAKIFYAKEATIQMLKYLDPDDYINIYSFNGRVSRVVSMERIKNLDAIAKRIADIKLGGGTDLYKVIEYMYRDIIALRSKVSNTNDDPKSVKVILVTDGNPTVGMRNENKIIELSGMLGKYVSVSLVIGIGDDYNEKLLMNIASKTNGFFEHLSDPSTIPSLVEKMVSRYRELSAKNVKLFIRPAPGVGIYVYNKTSYNVRGGVEVEVGDVHAGEAITVVGEFIVPPQRKGLTFLASISTKYEDVNGNEIASEVATVNIPCLQSSVASQTIDIDDKVFKEVNVVRMASALARGLVSEVEPEKLNELVQELVNATVDIDRRELYTRTIDLKAQLEREGVSPEVVKKLVSLLSKVLSGRYD